MKTETIIILLGAFIAYKYLQKPQVNQEKPLGVPPRITSTNNAISNVNNCA